jgi:hypothetical protein
MASAFRVTQLVLRIFEVLCVGAVTSFMPLRLAGGRSTLLPECMQRCLLRSAGPARTLPRRQTPIAWRSMQAVCIPAVAPFSGAQGSSPLRPGTHAMFSDRGSHKLTPVGCAHNHVQWIFALIAFSAAAWLLNNAPTSGYYDGGASTWTLTVSAVRCTTF